LIQASAGLSAAIDVAQRPPARDEVHVRVVEARRHGGALGVDDARGRTDQRLDLVRGADLQDRVAFDGHGLRPGVGVVHHVHGAVQDHEVGGVRGRRGSRRVATTGGGHDHDE
jgi:hypothetical protein